MAARIKALLVDESKVSQKRFIQLLNAECELIVTTDLAEALKVIAREHFQLFLIEQALRTGSGLELGRILRSMDEYKKVPILLLSSAPTRVLAYAAMRIGINACIDKVGPAEVLKETILKQLDTPHVERVSLEYVETKCIEWRDGSKFYQFSPELSFTTSGNTSEEAYNAMAIKLREVLSSSRAPNVYSEEIRVVSHCFSIQD